jgi:predicted Fe-Mo cluster-binding NifX family protein
MEGKMTFGERMRDLLDQGVAASKELAVKAGAKAQDLGERGVLMLEIRQLESHAQKLIGRLGAEAYQAFKERGEETLSADSSPVKTLLADITSAKESIESKEAELKLRKNK